MSIIKKSKQSGMTIVELLIASLILSIVFMGYTALQIRSIFDTEYANRNNIASFLSGDLIGIIETESYSQKSTDDKKVLFKKYEESFKTNSYSNNIKNCKSKENINDINYCNEDLMIDYNVYSFKEALKNNIPNPKVAFTECKTSDNYCFIVAWNQTLATEESCKRATSSCLIREVIL